MGHGELDIGGFDAVTALHYRLARSRELPEFLCTYEREKFTFLWMMILILLGNDCYAMYSTSTHHNLIKTHAEMSTLGLPYLESFLPSDLSAKVVPIHMHRKRHKRLGNRLSNIRNRMPSICRTWQLCMEGNTGLLRTCE